MKIEEEQKKERREHRQRREYRQKRVSENDKRYSCVMYIYYSPCINFPSLCWFSKEVWVLPWEVDKMDDMQSSTSSTSDVYSPSSSTGAFVPEQPNSEVCMCAVTILLCHLLRALMG